MSVRVLKTQDKLALERLKQFWRPAEAEGLTKMAVAKHAGVSPVTITRVFQGKLAISRRLCLAFAELLGVEPSDINPKWGDGFEPVTFEQIARVPMFTTFAELYQFFFKPETVEVDLTLAVTGNGANFMETTECRAAVERSRECIDAGVPATNQVAFFRMLQFAALRLSERLWFASVGDILIIDLQDKTQSKDKIKIYSWDNSSCHMGYISQQGASVYLTNPDWHKPADLTGAQCIGTVRSVQF